MKMDAIRPLRQSRGHGILKPIDLRHSRFAPLTEIDPCVRVLMNEQGTVTINIVVVLVGDRGPAPGIPRRSRYSMGGRGNGQQIKNHQLAIVVPASGYEALFRMPAHGEQVAISV